MEFRILGPLEVLDDGRNVDIGGAKQRTLLAILLLHANEVVSYERLIDELWEEGAPATGRKALHVYVSQLRKALGAHRLETRSPGYVLSVSDEELDLRRFHRLVSSGKPDEALALWRGAPLAEFSYQRFAQSEIARLEELRLACLEDRTEAGLAAGRHATLIGELEALVAEHPLRERPRGQLMLALYRSGRQAEALEAYQNARRALTEELGIELSQELRELERAILRQDGALALVAPREEQFDVVDSVHPIFVGRKPEVEELFQGFKDAAAGRGRLFLLVGEPGIGKSRLAEEVIRRVVSQRGQVMVGRCWEGGGAPAYWPWVQSIREYVRTADPDALAAQLGSGGVDVAQIVPELRDRLLGIPEPPTVESESARFRLFDSTSQFLRNVAAECPLLLVLEDLHAADESSLLLLQFVAAGLSSSRILVVGTYRDVDPGVKDPLAATLAELAREPVTRRLQLGGLAEEDVARFIELTTETTSSAELVSAIHDETEGNPLFVGEVVRLLASEGQLRAADGEALPTLGVPQGIREVIGRRLRRLSDDCVRLLTLASVLGREFRVDVLERLSELPADGLLEALDEAVSARLVTGSPASLGRLRFAHALIRDTLYDELTTPRRVLLHRRAGEVLEAFYGQDDEAHLAEVAHHFFEAVPGGNVERAVDYARRAAEHAVRLLAFEEAARLYGSALDALDLTQPVDESARCDLLLGLGEAQARAGDETAASAAFLGAAELARSTGSAEQLARAALGYGGLFVWMVSGMDENVVPLLDDALRELGEQESALRAKVLARLAGALRDQPEPLRRVELTARAVDIARRLEDHSALAYALDGQYCAVWGPDNPEERLDIAEELLTVSGNVGDRERKIQGHYYRAVALLELGRVHDSRTELDAMDRVAGELRQPAHHWYVEVLRGILELVEGDFDEAERSIGRGLEFARSLRSRLSPMAFKLQSMILDRERGRLDQGIAVMEQSVDEMPTLTAFRCILASLYAERGRDAEARAILEAVAETEFEVLPDNDKLYGWSLLGEVCHVLGDRTHAPALYELLLPYAARNVVCHPGCAIGSLARYLGLLATLLGHLENADRHFQAALEMNARMGARPWLAHTQEDYARMLFDRDAPGDQEKARELLTTALATYRELGMDGPLAKASALAEG
jgi:DNA-binding SARP family transcriptional activator